jgi:hypothetical protein
VICTGQFKEALGRGHEIVTKLSKAEVNIEHTFDMPFSFLQVCQDLHAQFLIDDSIENALSCATAKPAIRTLLFGDYEWNQRMSGPWDHKDEMSFEIRLEMEGGREFWKEEKTEIPAGVPVWRVKDWAEVLRWVKSHET